MNDWNEIYNTSKEWILEAGDYIREKMKSSINVSSKANQNDLVTDVDKAVEEFFIEKLKDKYPTHRLMGEEGSAELISNLNGTVWILDPIDGTVNFVHQECFFAVSLGIYHEGVGMVGFIYDVMKDELFTALKGHGAYVNGKKLDTVSNVSLQESILSVNVGWILEDRRLEYFVKEARGFRSYGSAALEIAYVAAGRLEAYISFALHPWDIAGGAVILKEVGGIVSNYEGRELTYLNKDTFIAANPAIHELLMDKLHN
ncbi:MULTISPECIES: inositol monophosphatase family protein [Bacillaceae]|uniref:inositol-phosphate phosphatase n=1 Tax=Evansella alkalicola TaxID=745819 RepID=A0ABS6JTM6_9BACI|nr:MULTISPECIES: inositol monophosphatase family protein [Bacillaceae]MBU9720495.1 inositol monophosphatase family protein [Bacillus alkalicola]